MANPEGYGQDNVMSYPQVRGFNDQSHYYDGNGNPCPVAPADGYGCPTAPDAQYQELNAGYQVAQPVQVAKSPTRLASDILDSVQQDNVDYDVDQVGRQLKQALATNAEFREIVGRYRLEFADESILLRVMEQEEAKLRGTGSVQDADRMRTIRNLLRDCNLRPGSAGHTTLVKEYLKLSGQEEMIETIFPSKKCCGCSTRCNIACAGQVAALAGVAASVLFCLGAEMGNGAGELSFLHDANSAAQEAIGSETYNATTVNIAGGALAGVSVFSLAAVLLFCKRLDDNQLR